MLVPGFGRCERREGQRVYVGLQLVSQRTIDSAMAFNRADAFERLGYNSHAEVRFAAGAAASVPRMTCAFVFHEEFYRRETFGQLLCNGIRGTHAYCLALSPSECQGGHCMAGRAAFCAAIQRSILASSTSIGSAPV